jgi:hypothetical protein
MKTGLEITSPRLLAILAFTAIVSAQIGCGSSDDSPFAKPGETGSGGDPKAAGTMGPGSGPSPSGGETADSGAGTTVDSDTGTTVDAGGGTAGSGAGAGCGTTPKRYVVLGHSVAHCFAVGGINSDMCSLKTTHSLMAQRYPGITYENYAVDGAVIPDVVKTQLAKVAPGPGHVFVNLFIGGNDLAAHITESDTAAVASWEKLKPQAIADHETMFAYFNDKSKFPDGATFMINSQYNPFDECVAGFYSFVSLRKQQIIGEFNQVLSTLVSAHKNSALVDQYSSFLGHGHNAKNATCPKYVANYAVWMSDMVHPNAEGHVNLGKEMSRTIDGIYTCK